jgi:hypothetical protein
VGLRLPPNPKHILTKTGGVAISRVLLLSRMWATRRTKPMQFNIERGEASRLTRLTTLLFW